MRPLSKADRSMSHRRSTDSDGRPESAVAAIWLIFYVFALGVAIASPFVSEAIELASR